METKAPEQMEANELEAANVGMETCPVDDPMLWHPGGVAAPVGSGPLRVERFRHIGLRLVDVLNVCFTADVICGGRREAFGVLLGRALIESRAL
ncbi:unnamed protein product [Heligmosomoides polygyrus]|uniref:Uncharacterized protein n=1 Tax=Heligmosomoides polygyrus TaxID=6339 RepID=A0A183GG65_HELPZ|nr:unnamed protein product [Heligmosomoides polygyrus]